MFGFFIDFIRFVRNVFQNSPFRSTADFDLKCLGFAVGHHLQPKSAIVFETCPPIHTRTPLSGDTHCKPCAFKFTSCFYFLFLAAESWVSSAEVPFTAAAKVVKRSIRLPSSRRFCAQSLSEQTFGPAHEHDLNPCFHNV